MIKMRNKINWLEASNTVISFERVTPKCKTFYMRTKKGAGKGRKRYNTINPLNIELKIFKNRFGEKLHDDVLDSTCYLINN